VEALMNIGFPLCAAMGFVPHPFPLLSGLQSAEKLFSAFIVDEIGENCSFVQKTIGYLTAFFND
jgi:hypothetical protein